MLEARVLEDCNEMISEETPTLSNSHKDFNVEFVDAFTAAFPDPQYLQEFTYGIDCLTDMAQLQDFPQDRMLDNEDISESTAKILKRVGLMTGNKSLVGIAVSPAVSEHIKEFFSYEYPKLMGTVFAQLKTSFLVFNLDGISFQMIYYKNIAMLDNLDSIRLSWTDTNKEKQSVDYTVYLPFLSKRAR
jgi:hypothetical protein